MLAELACHQFQLLCHQPGVMHDRGAGCGWADAAALALE